MTTIDPQHQAEMDALWESMPEEWRNLPDDEVTACGVPYAVLEEHEPEPGADIDLPRIYKEIRIPKDDGGMIYIDRRGDIHHLTAEQARSLDN